MDGTRGLGCVSCIYMCVHRLLLGLLVDRDFDALERWCLPGTETDERAFVTSAEIFKPLVFESLKQRFSNVLYSLNHLVRYHAPIRQFSASTIHVDHHLNSA